MNRYSLWKYIVIAVALAIGALFTLPNFFPDVPAVQSSGTMVFSKRKNKEQREEEQAREREEMEKREAEVATLLVRGQVSGSGSERPSKMSRMDASNYDTDDSSSIQLNSGVIEELLRPRKGVDLGVEPNEIVVGHRE